MTQDKIPFSVELWQKGYKVVTRDGREVKQLVTTTARTWELTGMVDGWIHIWTIDGKFSLEGDTAYDLFLLPPDEIVVEVVNGLMSGFSMINTTIFDANKVPPGKYKLVKI